MQKSNLQEFEEDIANIIKGIAYFDIIIENQKIKNAENPNFDAYSAWSQIDLKQQGYIDITDLNKFLSVNRIAGSTKECQYIINLNSKNGKLMTQQEFIDYILPKTNPNLKQLSIRRRDGLFQNRHAHFNSNQVIIRNSEYLASEIIFQEIKGFREIEDLRKKFSNKQRFNIQQIFQVVDYNNKGIIDFEVLHKFMKKNGVEFNEDEFKAFISRTTEDGDSKLDYEELIIALMPIDPYTYPHYREEFDSNGNKQYMIRKAQEFKADTMNPPLFFDNTKKTQKKLLKSTSTTLDTKYYSYNYPIKKFYDPYQNGRPTYNCDEGYMGQLKGYQEAYYKPSKESGVQYTNRFSEGVRYHDQHFEKFYKFLHDRDQNEQLFNKFGKRYAFDNNMNRAREYMNGLGKQELISKHSQSVNNTQKSYAADTLRFNYNNTKDLQNKTIETEFKSTDNLKTFHHNKNDHQNKHIQQTEEVDFDDY